VSITRRLLVASVPLLVVFAAASAPAATAVPAVTGVAPAAATSPALPGASPSPASDPCSLDTGPAKKICQTAASGTADTKCKSTFGSGNIIGGGLCKASQIAAPAAQKEFNSQLNDSIVKPIAEAIADFTTTVIKGGLAWWLTLPSVQVESSGVTSICKGQVQNPDASCSGGSGSGNSLSLQGILYGAGVLIATLLTIIQGIRTAIRRKGTPLMEALQGLLVMVLVCGVGIGVIDGLLAGSDVLTDAILNTAFNGKANAPDVLVKVLLPAGPLAANPMAVILMAVVVLLVGIVQCILLFLRQAAVPIQALMLPVAGAGQVGGPSTRQWLPRLMTAIMTVIVYKPLAALIIAVGFVEVTNAPDIVSWIRGVVTLVLSVIALKALIGVFAPLGVAVGGGAGGGMLGPALDIAARAMGRGQGGGSSAPTSAVDHAKDMERSRSNSSTGTGIPQQPGGSRTVEHANSPTPEQTSPEQSSPEETATGDGAQTAAQGAAQGAGQTVPKAATGPVGIAMVAAEATHQGVQAAGNTVSEGSKGQQ
jgi:type IV secretion system protein TrbL